MYLMRKALALLLSLSIAAPAPAAMFRPTPAVRPLPVSRLTVRPVALVRQRSLVSPVSALALAHDAQASLKLTPPALYDSMPVAQVRTAGAELFGESLGKPAFSNEVAGAWGLGTRLDLKSREAGESAREKTPPAPERGFLLRHTGLLRRLIAPIVRLLYRIDVTGLEDLPAGPAVIVPNHPSYIDGVLIAFATRRPLRFLLKRKYYDKMPRFFRSIGAIPIAATDSAELREQSLAEAAAALKAGETVVIFPEGAMTRDGSLLRFHRGFETIAAKSGAPVIPAHIDGMWGSRFSLREGVTFGERLRALRRPVTIHLGKPLASAGTQAAREAVEELGAEAMAARVKRFGKTLPREFLRTAKRLWSKKAVADSTGQDLKFGKTLTAALLLAGALQARLPEGKNVGVLLPPSAGGALANLALPILGKVPVNLNYKFDAQEMAHAEKTASLGVTITSRKFLKALGPAPLPSNLVYLEDLLPLIPAWKKPLTFLALRALPRWAIEALWFRRAPRSLDETATVLFTSGSSSLPKGVELTHGNVRSNIEMVREVFPLSTDDVVLGVLPFFHSFGYTVSFWFPMTQGLAAAYHPNPLEPGKIAKLAAETKASLLLGTPYFLSLYTQKVPAEAFHTLKLVIAGGEKLRAAVADEFKDKFGVKPLEGYGTTELSPVVSVNLPDRGQLGIRQRGGKVGSVGKALPGTFARVVDPETLAPLPYGEEGMLVVKGAQVMKGYLGQPEKTAEVLKDGWYVTGDVATIDKDGFITLVGRLSRFSKIGDMVSHVKVEEKLQEAAGVADMTFFVAGAPDATAKGEKLVVLYAGWDGDAAELVAKLKKAGVKANQIPSPSEFFKVEKIPVLGTGKLDLKAATRLARELSKTG